MDEIDRRLLTELLRNARASLKELAAHIELSSPATSERLRRLEERGLVRGYTAEVDLAVLGFPIEAIVRIRPLPGMLHRVQRLIEEISQISECDKVTGDDCFIARLHLRRIEELDGILEPITEKAETNTSIVKGKVLARRVLPLN